jgi:hypothetical protein
MEKHIQTLGILRIALGILGALIAAICLVIFGSLAGLVATVGVREDPDAIIGAWALGIIGGIVFLFIGVLSVPSIVAGYGLLHHRSWARILTIVLSALDLFNVPIGTAVGVYGFWVLLSNESEAIFNRQPIRRVA